jgi:hypothetical protein
MWWHPWVVLLAWIRLYRKLPTVFELIAIIFHDIGYWGCEDMDGECGITHPIRGAVLTSKICRGLLFLLRPLGVSASLGDLPAEYVSFEGAGQGHGSQAVEVVRAGQTINFI